MPSKETIPQPSCPLCCKACKPKAVKADAQNADAQNFLAYAYRRSGQLDPAFDHYAKALAINPRHKGANEYIGQAYLLIGNFKRKMSDRKPKIKK